MTLLNTSPESETRILTRIGIILVLFVVIATFLYLMVNPFARRSHDVISLAIETPYVGQGVAAGTPILMHGMKIGQVVSVLSIPGGGVRLKTDLQPGPTRGLTDAMGIDYRPSNYFGVTGINVIPAENGRPLQSGMQLRITPTGNFSLQALIYRLGELSNGVFNERLISVIQRATQYADGLTPLLETALIVTNSLAKVQTVSTERLLRNATGVSIAFPGFVDALFYAGNNVARDWFSDSFDFETFKRTDKYWPVFSGDLNRKKAVEWKADILKRSYLTSEYNEKYFLPLITTAFTDLFSRVGNLEYSHMNDLFPAVESVRALADTVPKILSPDSFAYTLTEIRSRLERMYAGSGDERALQVRIILDRLPGVAAPLGLVGGS
jgi:hypothetical protein